MFFSCKKPYDPPALQVDYKYLVVDGSIVSSLDSPTVISLSRTTKLSDSIKNIPEGGASVSVEEKGGAHFPLNEITVGVYKGVPALLNYNSQYRLRIITNQGDEYLSDFVTVKQTPPIDSVTWEQKKDVNIYLNTHDPSSSSKYYRWDFTETWEYNSSLNADISLEGNMIFYVDQNNQTYNCWMTSYSSQVLTATSIALKSDNISHALITTIPQNSEKIGTRYSILIKQYSITPEAYQYFQLLKKNTETVGSIFDAQPAQLYGNFTCVNDKNKIVIGYITASNVTQQKIFINHNQLTDWNPEITGRSCDIITIGQDPSNNLLYEYPDPEYAPYYFSGCCSIVLARKSCVDCRVKGGVNHKPLYW